MLCYKQNRVILWDLVANVPYNIKKKLDQLTHKVFDIAVDSIIKMDQHFGYSFIWGLLTHSWYKQIAPSPKFPPLLCLHFMEWIYVHQVEITSL